MEVNMTICFKSNLCFTQCDRPLKILAMPLKSTIVSFCAPFICVLPSNQENVIMLSHARAVESL